MSDDEFNEEHIPIAYLITFRPYGTWLHGDERGSVDKFNNQYGTPRITANQNWQRHNERSLKQPPVHLDAARRESTKAAIRETCMIRSWLLHAVNIRTNHVHSVVSAGCSPKRILSAFKANATRKMRESGCWNNSNSPWALKGSKRYLWTERNVVDAIDYVLYGQGDELPSFD
jgi:REP element-mobilizing transposase RayT